MKSQKKSKEKEIKITVPKEVTFVLNGNTLTAKGPKGEVTKDFKMPIKLAIKEGELVIVGNDLVFLNTTNAHISNMIDGVTKGFRKEFKILYAHFPMTIEVKGKDILIKNFLGEKKPREAKIKGNVKIEVKGKEMSMTSCSIEDIGQTAANIKTALKIRERDSRVFQDGIYEVEQNE